MKHVFIAGATGYLGKFLCAEYQKQGWHVTALVRDSRKVENLQADRVLEAQATWPESLHGCMTGVDLVVSALGITRQADGLGYWDVDYQANLNLLAEAKKSNVSAFAFVHVLNADRLDHVPMVAAKSAFVRELQASGLESTIIAPTAYFSDMGDFLKMAQSGRAWVFGSGETRINPIHGADLAHAIYTSVDAGQAWADIGGPETFTQTQLAQLCFEVLGTKPRISHLPDFIRRAALWLFPKITPRHVSGPAQFFLSAGAMNMTAKAAGTRRLVDHYKSIADENSWLTQYTQ